MRLIAIEEKFDGEIPAWHRYHDRRGLLARREHFDLRYPIVPRAGLVDDDVALVVHCDALRIGQRHTDDVTLSRAWGEFLDAPIAARTVAVRDVQVFVMIE